MRPPVLPSGNYINVITVIKTVVCFNEAAGFTQRKLRSLVRII